jgi:anthranilate phosphoribosyltransferase
MTAFEDAGGWGGVLARLFHRRDLSAELAGLVFEEILEGRALPEQIAAFAAALRTKGETVEELTSFVASMLAHAELVEVTGELVDTCGTGGDRSGTINVSTMAACVVAGAGGRVCKHGGRAATSRAGSADVLQALGVAVDLGPAGVARCIETTGFGFCFAPRFHPAMRHAAAVRRNLGAPTVFNLLGPLANPARASRQVIGVGEPAMAETMLGVLETNGATHAMVLFGHDGLDELSTVATSTVLETRLTGSGGRERRRYEVDARQLGLPAAVLSDLAGGDPEDNARHVREVLGGSPGPRRDVVLLNSAAGLVVAGLAPDLAAGVALAAATIDSGRAAGALEGLIRVSNVAAREREA